MNTVIILAGFLALVTGYQLSGIYVAAVGVVLGERLATYYHLTSGMWDTLVFALLSGLLGYLLAHYFRKIPVYLAVFLCGGYLSMSLLPMLGWLNRPFSWIGFLVGGVIALVLVLVYYSFGVILVSSLSGAVLLAAKVSIPGLNEQVMFVVLWIFGMATQLVLLQYSQPSQA